MSLLLALCLLVGDAFAVRPLPPTLTPPERLRWHSADGWTGELLHYPGPGRPLMLVHGMSANHYNWDYRPEVSLSDWLQARGWDVWIPALRGDPGTVAPSARAARNFSFDDYALQDLPAALDVIQEQTGESQVAWVGHSMGGMLLYAALASYPERIRAGVAISSPARFDSVPAAQELLGRAGRLIGAHGLIRNNLFFALSRPLGHANPAWPRIANMQNMDYGLALGLASDGIEAIPRALVQQAVDWMRARELVRVDGSPWLAAPSPAVPLLVLAGDQDWIAPGPNVLAACDVLPACDRQIMGPAGGLTVSYGHVDPVVGRTAPTEIYPLISTWLAAHTPP